MYNVPSEASRLDPQGAESVIPVGPLAQLGERRVRNAEVEGSNPLRSTSFRLWLSNEFATDDRLDQVPPPLLRIAAERVKRCAGQKQPANLRVESLISLGGAPFGTLSNPRYGAWVASRGGGFEATSLFLEADGATGTVLNITKVHLTLWFNGNSSSSISGVANVEVVPCAAGPAPFMTLNCPNPVLTAGVPSPPFDIPVQLTRLRVGG